MADLTKLFILILIGLSLFLMADAALAALLGKKYIQWGLNYLPVWYGGIITKLYEGQKIIFWCAILAEFAIGFLMFLNLTTMAGYSNANPDPLPFKDGENSITFIGHGTTLIHLNNTNILTDPIFNDWIMVFHRIRAPGMKIENLPKIDAILISHAHRDHLDKWSMKQFQKDTPVLISKGNGDILREWGFTDVREMDLWGASDINGIKITAAPAKHSGARNSATADYPKALSYVLEGNRTIYFAGDTGLSGSFKEIGSKYKIDLALLPIGAYKPRWFMKSHHMSPQDALEAMKMLGAKEMIPIHWGSFKIALDGVDEPKEVLAGLIENSSVKNKVRILENGEKYVLK